MTNSSLVSFVSSTFHVADYVVFALFLLLSGAVGVFFSIRGQKNTQDYFLGGRKMRPVPVGISLGVSFMSAASLVGLPAEVYVNGYSFIFFTIGMTIGFLVGNAMIIQVLHPLSLTSISEYLKLRYRSPLVTYSTNIMVLICIFEYMGFCMLGSVIAFSSATGGTISVEVALLIGGAVGVFYTSIGGMKAVVWSDVIQFFFMFVGIVAVVIRSIVDTPGGMSEIMEMAVKYGRVHAPDWSFDMTVRHTMWGLVIGYMFNWMPWAVQPACVQRLCCTQTKKDAYIVTIIGIAIFYCTSLLPIWAGVNIFGYYASRGCDVLAAGWIKDNEIISYYVRERLNFPGFQGMFVAALYAGSLSSLSSGLNVASSILWKDTITPLLKVEVSEVRATLISKMIVVVLGLVSMGWCYSIYKIGGLILQLAYTLDSSMYGAYFGVVVLSVLVAHANWKSAFFGMVVSFVLTLSMGVTSLMSGKASGLKLPTTIDNCELNGTESNASITFTIAKANSSSTDCTGHSLTQLVSSISYEWFAVICFVISLTTSLMVIGCSGPQSVSARDRRMVIRCRPGCGQREENSDSEDAEEANDEEEAFKAGFGSDNNQLNLDSKRVSGLKEVTFCY